MTLLYLIRHARSIWNAEGRWQGQADPPLDAVGLRQAQTLAEHLRKETFAAVYSSPLLRARQTAEVLAQAWNAPLRLDDRLMERNVGLWAGLTPDEVRARFPEHYHPDWYINGAPEGEDHAALTARAVAVFAGIVAAHPEDRVAVVSHGGALNAYLADLFGIPPTRRVIFRFDNASHACLAFKDGRVALMSLVGVEYLNGLKG